MLRCSLSDVGSYSVTLEPVLGLNCKESLGTKLAGQSEGDSRIPGDTEQQLERHGTSGAQPQPSDSGCGLKTELTGHADGWAVG